jgi:hypothetical protein
MASTKITFINSKIEIWIMQSGESIKKEFDITDFTNSDMGLYQFINSVADVKINSLKIDFMTFHRILGSKIDLMNFIDCRCMSICDNDGNVEIIYTNLPSSLVCLTILNCKYTKKKIDLCNLPITLKRLVLSWCDVDNINYLPCGLEEINMYEVYSDENIFELPPSVINCLITSVARNISVKNLLCSGYYLGDLVDFTKQYIQSKAIVSHNT